MDFIRIVINIMAAICVFCVLILFLFVIVSNIIQYLHMIYNIIKDFRNRKTSECSICLNIVTNKPLKCGHVFHDKCIKTWLKEHETCPNCRCEV